MNFQLSKTFTKRLSQRLERYEIEVGILENKEYREPMANDFFGEPKLGQYAGGPVRKASRVASGKKIGEVLVANMQRLNINLLSRPFQESKTEFAKFVKAFLEFAAAGNASSKRVENLAQAIVRNPILRQEYGENSEAYADLKGFNRHLIDTAQTFKAIKAKVIRRV